MPEKIFCARCRFLLYYGEIISRRLYMRAIPSEEVFLSHYKNRCPRCGNELSLNTILVDIRR